MVNTNKNLRERNGQLALENEKLKTALQKIAEWKLPDTERYWDNEKRDPMSYTACYGSNGERDYIKSIAINALNNKP